MNEFLLSVERFQQQCRWFIKATYQFIDSRSEMMSRLTLLVLLAAFFVFMLGLPIHMNDTDMWYHLAGGRFSWENWTLNDFAFFSYLSPQPEWVNYFWGFQVLIYKLHQAFGFTGLIVFKALMLLSVAYLIVRMVMHGNGRFYLSAAQLGIVVLLIFLLIDRSYSVRPHLVSYFFIALFSYILFFQKKTFFILPLCTLLWVNLHGIEWVVGALICGAYVLQQLNVYYHSRDKNELKSLPWVLLCLPVLLINPYGVELLTAPFNITSEAYHYIDELKPPPLGVNFLFNANYTLSTLGALNLLFLLACAGFAGLWFSGRLSLGVFILSLGGFVLLFRGYRFLWEWMLLMVPLFAIALKAIQQQSELRLHPAVKSGFLVLVLVSPLSYMVYKTSYERYPVNDLDLPVATTSFIEKMGLKGRYFVDPSYAGYMEWKLYPDVLIHLDMEFPPFDEMDFLKYSLAVTRPTALQSYVKEYAPDMIGVNRLNTPFKQHAQAIENYVPVSVDQALVLYINKNKFPEIAEQYQIRTLDVSHPLLGFGGENIDSQIEELEKILSYEPNNAYVLMVLNTLLLEANRMEQIGPSLTRLVEQYPDLESSYYLKAIAAYNSRDFQAAIDALEKARLVNKHSPGRLEMISKYMALAYFQMEHYDQAYYYFRKTINIYRSNEKIENFFKYAKTAFLVDDVAQAKRICEMILYMGDSETQAYRDAGKLLEIIQQENYKRPFWKL